MAAITIPLNFEMAATDEMQRIALAHRPHAACIVPERREERTTEGGLEVAGDDNRLAAYIAPLRDAGIRVSLFIAADPAQIEAAARIGAPVIETAHGRLLRFPRRGRYRRPRCGTGPPGRGGAQRAADLGLEVHMGHGLAYDTVGPIAALPEVAELNIGHFLIGEAVFVGLPQAIAKMREMMEAARG